MKAIILALACVTIASISHAQVFLSSEEFRRNGTDFKMETFETVNLGHKVEISNPGGDKEIFYIREPNSTEFGRKLDEAIQTLTQSAADQAPKQEEEPAEIEQDNESDSPEPAADGEEESNFDLFEQFKAAVQHTDEAPVAGWLKVNHRVKAIISNNGWYNEDGDLNYGAEPFVVTLPNSRKYSIGKETRRAYASVERRSLHAENEMKQQMLQTRNDIAKVTAVIANFDSLREETLDSLKAEKAQLVVLQKEFDKRSSQADSIARLFQVQMDSILDSLIMNESFATLADTQNQANIAIEKRLKRLENEKSKRLLAFYKRVLEPTQKNFVLTQDTVDTLRSRLKALNDSIFKYTLKLHNNQKISLFQEREYFARFRNLKLESLQLEFNEGMIERVVANLSVEKPSGISGNGGDSVLTFFSGYPIGFSTIRNFDRGIRSCLLVNPDSGFAIPLSALIHYEPNLQLNTRDFSPHDTVITFNGDAHKYKMHKDNFAQLLRGSVFTDVVGIKEDEPNGLLQFEVDKRINLYTKRMGSSLVNCAFVQFVRPGGTLSKIESKLRQMPTTYDVYTANNEMKTKLTALNTDILRYENFSAGIDFNVFLLDFQHHKFTFYLNVGNRFGHVLAADTIRRVEQDSIISTGIPNPHSVNTIRYYPELIFDFFPDTHFKFSLQYRVFPIISLSEIVNQIPREGHPDPVPTNSLKERTIHTFQLGTTFKPNPKSRVEFYFRYRLHMQHIYFKTNFYQAQFGTSFYITKKITEK